MSWSDRYIGVPYQDFGRSLVGSDCWGLACIIYAAELGIDLPQYSGDYASVDEHQEIAALISGAAISPLWIPVAAPQPLDIAVFRRGRFSSHLGVVIRPGLMIHMDGEDQSKVQTYANGPYKHRLVGTFRYALRSIEPGVKRSFGGTL